MLINFLFSTSTIFYHLKDEKNKKNYTNNSPGEKALEFSMM